MNSKSRICTGLHLPILIPNTHCVKSVRIWSYSGLHFPTFGLNTERYGVSHRIQSECGKMWTRITPNTDTFYAETVLIITSSIHEHAKQINLTTNSKIS